jgi:hypothetical protein
MFPGAARTEEMAGREVTSFWRLRGRSIRFSIFDTVAFFMLLPELMDRERTAKAKAAII